MWTVIAVLNFVFNFAVLRVCELHLRDAMQLELAMQPIINSALRVKKCAVDMIIMTLNQSIHNVLVLRIVVIVCHIVCSCSSNGDSTPTAYQAHSQQTALVVSQLSIDWLIDWYLMLRTITVWFTLRPRQHDNGYVDGRTVDHRFESMPTNGISQCPIFLAGGHPSNNILLLLLLLIIIIIIIAIKVSDTNFSAASFAAVTYILPSTGFPRDLRVP